MELFPQFFLSLQKNETPSPLIIEAEDPIDKIMDEFVSVDLNIDISKLLNQIHEILEHSQRDVLPTNPVLILNNIQSLNAKELYEEYERNKKIINQCVKLIILKNNELKKGEQTKNGYLPSPTKIRTIIKSLLKRNIQLTKRYLERFNNARLEQDRIKAVKQFRSLSNKGVSHHTTRVLESQFERVDKNRNAKKLTIELLKEDRVMMQESLNQFKIYASLYKTRQSASKKSPSSTPHKKPPTKPKR